MGDITFSFANNQWPILIPNRPADVAISKKMPAAVECGLRANGQTKLSLKVIFVGNHVVIGVFGDRTPHADLLFKFLKGFVDLS